MEDIRGYITSGGLDQAFRRDGAVCLRGVLTGEELAHARDMFEWLRANPGPNARAYETFEGIFFQDAQNERAWPRFAQLCETVPYGDIAAALLGVSAVWFNSDQIFLKTGGNVRRTPWHQDTPPGIGGRDFVVLWTSFEPVPKENALEFVRGSHEGPLYNNPTYEIDDDTAPLYDADLPRVPPIETQRAQWDIVSWPTEPGDVLAFHYSTLHGGAKTDPTRPRRTLVTRYIGEDAWRTEGRAVKLQQQNDGVGLDDSFLEGVNRYTETVPVGSRLNSNPAFFKVPLLRKE